MNRFKKTLSIVTITLFVLAQTNLVSVSYAFDAPEAPTPPPAPTDAPEAPTPPPGPTDIPEAPTPPPAPTDAPEAPTPPPAPTDTPEATGTLEPTPEGTPTTVSEEQLTSDPELKDTESDGTSADGNVGDTSVDTGDATSAGIISNDVNSNVSVTPECCSSSATVVNEDNGSESDNDSSATITNEDVTDQDNSAVVVNNMDNDSTTGKNSSSSNVGDSSITTGDANTTGTILNAVNTNVDGVMVAEFNIADDHVGDIILDYSGSCISGCGVAGAEVGNTGNGEGSDNDANLEIINSDLTFQDNDADLENNMLLTSISGDNRTDRNTAGDSTIDTGDANVAANLVNMVNNNFTGQVIYGVVNIFGDLIGDIIMPADASTQVANSGNGAGSTNTATADISNSDETYQFNTADIDNNLNFNAQTGENATSRNTNGTNSIETGNAEILAQVVNIANLNLAEGDYWLVIVNEAGQWVGKILGAPEGSSLAGSELLRFIIGDNGDVTVANAGNGEGSTNDSNLSVDNTSVTQQNNTAHIENNVDLYANTGGNSASRNTGGNNSITTGDATIVANIINFVNTNISGNGRLFVNVINVFGSWFGDFVAPGMEKDSLAANSNGVGGSSSSSENNDGDSNGGEQLAASSLPIETMEPGVLALSIQGGEKRSQFFQKGFMNDLPDEALASENGQGTQTASERVTNINLAWFALFGGLFVAYFGIGKLRKKVLPQGNNPRS